jgi:hypothetical protein
MLALRAKLRTEQHIQVCLLKMKNEQHENPKGRLIWVALYSEIKLESGSIDFYRGRKTGEH